MVLFSHEKGTCNSINRPTVLAVWSLGFQMNWAEYSSISTTDLGCQQCQLCGSYEYCDGGPLLQELPGDVRKAALFPHLVAKGQHLFNIGDRLHSIFIVKAGIFKKYLTLETGDEQILSFAMPGEALGVTAIAKSAQPSSAIALEDSIICRISCDKLDDASRQLLVEWSQRQIQHESRQSRQLFMLTRSRYKAINRVAGFLLGISQCNARRGNSGTEFKLAICHRDIACYLDLALEDVSQAFSHMQQRGLINCVRDDIEISDLESLRQLAQASGD